MFIFALYYPNYKMKQDELFVITINRELGSGGRTIGRKLAEDLKYLSTTSQSSSS